MEQQRRRVTHFFYPQLELFVLFFGRGGPYRQNQKGNVTVEGARSMELNELLGTIENDFFMVIAAAGVG